MHVYVISLEEKDDFRVSISRDAVIMFVSLPACVYYVV